MVTVSKPRCGCDGKPGTFSPWYMLQPSCRRSPGRCCGRPATRPGRSGRCPSGRRRRGGRRTGTGRPSPTESRGPGSGGWRCRAWRLSVPEAGLSLASRPGRPAARGHPPCRRCTRPKSAPARPATGQAQKPPGSSRRVGRGSVAAFHGGPSRARNASTAGAHSAGSWRDSPCPSPSGTAGACTKVLGLPPRANAACQSRGDVRAPELVVERIDPEVGDSGRAAVVGVERFQLVGVAAHARRAPGIAAAAAGEVDVAHDAGRRIARRRRPSPARRPIAPPASPRACRPRAGSAATAASRRPRAPPRRPSGESPRGRCNGRTGRSGWGLPRCRRRRSRHSRAAPAPRPPRPRQPEQQLGPADAHAQAGALVGRRVAAVREHHHRQRPGRRAAGTR